MPGLRVLALVSGVKGVGMTDMVRRGGAPYALRAGVGVGAGTWARLFVRTRAHARTRIPPLPRTQVGYGVALAAAQHLAGPPPRSSDHVLFASCELLPKEGAAAAIEELHRMLRAHKCAMLFAMQPPIHHWQH